MKRAVVVHGWGGSPDEPLQKWLSFELKKLGFEVEAPIMPNTAKPVIEEWINKLGEVAGMPDIDTFFVGHSIGCQAVLRYLEKINRSVQVGGVVLIAPWLKLKGLDSEEEIKIAEPWIENEINYPRVSEHIPEGKLICIFSDDDPYVPEENRELFHDMLGAKIIVESEKGHFTSEDGVRELPSALEEILNIIKPRMEEKSFAST